ncbi:MAG: alpha-amylase family protein, partial [Armatimonadota bacterium]
DTELGAELTPEHLRERLERVQPDWIQCDCKGHAGYTSWPTEVGSPSPGIVKDALRIHRDVTKAMGIKLGMHYSGVWDTRALELHPEWARVEADGSRNPNMTCRLAGYTEQFMIPQMLELVEKYDVDGFWVDGENWASAPCWCELCAAEFTKRTGLTDIPKAAGEANWLAWLSFQRDLFTEHVTTYANAVHAVKPDCLICSNWMYTVRQPEPMTAPIDYISGDFTPSWGADRAAAEGRVMAGRGISWDLMAWGFTRTDAPEMPWATKTATHLCQEIAEIVALGGAAMIYDQPQRSGWLTSWHQDVFGEVAAWCRERQELCFQTQTASEAALLHLTSHYYTCNDPLFNLGSTHEPLEGAMHALLECGISTDIVLEHDALASLEQYKLVVVPGQTHLTGEIKAALSAYAEAGGCVLLTGAHVAEECAALAGVEAAGAAAEDVRVYLPAAGKAVPVFGPWQPVRALAGTEVWTCAMDQQEQGKDETEQVVVTARRVGDGWIVAAHGPLFRNYFKGHYPLLRRFIADLIARLEIGWTVRIAGPARLELVTRQRDGQLLVNLINRGAAETLSPSRVIVEELLPVENATVRVRCEAAPASVTGVGAEVAWSYADGELTITVPRLDIHCAIAIE